MRFYITQLIKHFHFLTTENASDLVNFSAAVMISWKVPSSVPFTGQSSVQLSDHSPA